VTTTIESNKRRASGPPVADDGTIVLPWWRNPVNMVAIVVAVAALFGAVGYTLGSRSTEVRGNAVDEGFLQDMRFHHENAVVIARTFLRTPDTDASGAAGNGVVRLIATEIELGQQMETGRMVQLLRMLGAEEAADLDQPAMAWMNQPTPFERMPGIATDEQVAELAGLSGPAADALFASLMIAHHQAGIHMAEYEVDHGDNDEAKDMARSMIVGQQGEIAELNRLGFS
jgi:uncharacterized protein (DUF305 family)